LQAAKVLKLPVTSDFRTNFQSYSKHYGVGWLRKPIVAYLRKFHNATACTMVPTKELRRTLSENGFLNLKVVARGVDTKLFNVAKRDPSLRAAWGASEQTKVLISVGRIAPEKNLDQVLKTFDALRGIGADVKLVMVGDGPLKEQFQNRYPEIIFPGMLKQADLAKYYASADLFVFPSQTETFGNVTLEALASGIPVLAFDCAAARDWVQTGVNGWLVAEDNPEGFAQQGVAVFKAPGMLAQVTQSTRQELVHLDWDQIAEQVETVFWDAIRSK
jgi:glycosyltransferase involved in cell wall biosynthesis